MENPALLKARRELSVGSTLLVAGAVVFLSMTVLLWKSLQEAVLVWGIVAWACASGWTIRRGALLAISSIQSEPKQTEPSSRSDSVKTADGLH